MWRLTSVATGDGRPDEPGCLSSKPTCSAVMLSACRGVMLWLNLKRRAWGIGGERGELLTVHVAVVDVTSHWVDSSCLLRPPPLMVWFAGSSSTRPGTMWGCMPGTVTWWWRRLPACWACPLTPPSSFMLTGQEPGGLAGAVQQQVGACAASAWAL